MAKKKKPSMAAQVTKDEQSNLFDVDHPMAKEILAVARAYRAAETDRLTALKEEVKLKEKIIELVRQAGIKPDINGKTTFKSGKIVITIQPRDELVKITERKEHKKKAKQKS